MNHSSCQSDSLNDVYQRPVKEIMSREVVSLFADDTIHEALSLMGEPIKRNLCCIELFGSPDLPGIRFTGSHTARLPT